MNDPGVALAAQGLATAVGKIQVWRGGNGAPVVYLHSAAGEGPGTVVLEALATDFDVVAPMFPGFGESEGIELIDDIEDAVYHLLDVFDGLGLVRPAVVGSSLGGWMAVEVASRYPERVSSLVLINPAGLHIDGAPIKEIFGRKPDELAEDLFADQSHPIAQVMHQMAALGADKLAEIPFELLRPTLQSLQATAKVAWNPYLHNPKLLRRLGRVTAPTLIVHGAEDRLIPAVHATTYASAIAGARLVEVRGGGHLVALEQPSVIADLIRSHLHSSRSDREP
jgi:pimeloyl-ACP methyl ester carboxylesterase